MHEHHGRSENDVKIVRYAYQRDKRSQREISPQSKNRENNG